MSLDTTHAFKWVSKPWFPYSERVGGWAGPARNNATQVLNANPRFHCSEGLWDARPARTNETQVRSAKTPGFECQKHGFIVPRGLGSRARPQQRNPSFVCQNHEGFYVTFERPPPSTPGTPAALCGESLSFVQQKLGTSEKAPSQEISKTILQVLK
jgi:hypothetical protein